MDGKTGQFQYTPIFIFVCLLSFFFFFFFFGGGVRAHVGAIINIQPITKQYRGLEGLKQSIKLEQIKRIWGQQIKWNTKYETTG